MAFVRLLVERRIRVGTESISQRNSRFRAGEGSGGTWARKKAQRRSRQPIRTAREEEGSSTSRESHKPSRSFPKKKIQLRVPVLGIMHLRALPLVRTQ